jgi:TonB family protein
VKQNKQQTTFWRGLLSRFAAWRAEHSELYRTALLHLALVLLLIIVAWVPSHDTFVVPVKGRPVVQATMVTLPPAPKPHPKREYHAPRHRVVSRAAYPEHHTERHHKKPPHKKEHHKKPHHKREHHKKPHHKREHHKKPVHHAKPKPKIDKAKLRRLAEQGIQSALAQARAKAEHQQQLLTDKQRAMALIAEVVRAQWINPFTDDGTLKVTLQISVDVSGKVQNVTVEQSSGNTSFDRQAVLAVQKASPLPMPKDAVLVGEFRVITLPFSAS